ncbi:MAG: porphobilinogen synthase [Nitrososphaeraceae archaeon]
MSLTVSDLIIPILVYPRSLKHFFLDTQKGGSILVSSDDRICSLVIDLINNGITDILLFGLPCKRDEGGTAAADKSGTVQVATRMIKHDFGSTVNVITDVCVCQYNISGHCGISDNSYSNVDNFKSLALLEKIATSHADSGADCVAPSSMMDGQVGSIRQALDSHGFGAVKIMSYSAKHASSLYGPFRSVAFARNNSQDLAFNKSAYQLPYSNRREAIREIEHDINEGANMVMIKPTLWYLDLVYEVKKMIDVPLVVQVVSGEYLMLRNREGVRGDNRDIHNELFETLISVKHAGSDRVITYITMDFLKHVAKSLS